MMTTAPPLRALSLVLGASLFGATSVLADPNAPCYFPGGGLAPGYFACHAFGAEVSSCCAPGWTCFSNSLCIATTETRSWPNITLGAVQRGACTAPKWNNEFCGSVCLTGEGADGHLAACGNDRYCCWSDFEAGRCNCDEGGGSFSIAAGLAQTIIQVTDATFTGTPSVSVATTKPALRTTSDSTIASITSGSTFATSVTSSRATAATASETVTETPKPGGNGRTLKIALGVAIPLGLLAIGLVAGWFVIKRKRDRASNIGRGALEPTVVDNYVGDTEDLTETHPHAPMRSFGEHYSGYNGTGNINTQG